MIGRLFRLAIVGVVISSIAGMIAAAVTKRRTPSVGDAASDEVALVTIFDGLEFESTASAFRGGSLLCWYGGGDVDLRGATLDPAGARLTVRLLFGGGRLLVPDEWEVDLETMAILGGVTDTREARIRPTDAPRLIVDGFAAFGGLAVFSTKPEAELDPVDALETIKAQAGDAKDAAEDVASDVAAAVTDDAPTELVPALDV